MMQFSQPSLLWALTALTLPLAIHLLSRKEGKVIRMGSLRHLRETSTRQFRGIKLNEVVLLTLRSLLICFFVLLLSGLHWMDRDEKRWLVVERGVEANPSVRKLADSLRAQGYEWHWLQKDFPVEKADLQNENFVDSSATYWHLIAALKQRAISQVIVLSRSRVENFRGMREAMGSNVQWITLPTEPTDFLAGAVPQAPDRIFVRRGHSQADRTSFETTLATSPLPDSVEVKPVPIQKVVIASDPGFENDQRILKAALDAIAKTLPITFQIRPETPAKASVLAADWLFWLSNKQLPTDRSSQDSIHVLSYQLQPSTQLLEPLSQTHWALHKRLTLETARQHNLTLQLASLFMDEKGMWNKMATYDRRVLPDSLLFKGIKTESRQAATGIVPPMNPALLLLLVLTLVIERMVAYQRNQ